MCRDAFDAIKLYLAPTTALFAFQRIRTMPVAPLRFPGYSWLICNCSTCFNHLGWRFDAVQPGLQPPRFWGLRRPALAALSRHGQGDSAAGTAEDMTDGEEGSGSQSTSEEAEEEEEETTDVVAMALTVLQRINRLIARTGVRAAARADDTREGGGTG